MSASRDSLTDVIPAIPEQVRSERGARFENIDLLRAFAALSVVVYHVIEHSKWTSFPGEGPLSTFRIGWLGVDLFFVISGFVITYSALALYRADSATFARNYWLRRLTRIVPLFLLTSVIWVLLSREFATKSLEDWLFQVATHLTFTFNFWTDSHSSINGVSWTLAVEMQFYLLVALLIGWIQRTPGWRIWLYAVAISWAWRGSMLWLYPSDNVWQLWMHVSQFPGALDEFAAGIFLAKMVCGERVPIAAKPAFWVAAACVTGYLVMSYFWNHAGYWDDWVMVVFWRTALAAFFACVLGAAIFLPQTLATRWLRPVAYLGEISYGIYLWHLFAVGAVIQRGGATELVALVGVLSMTIAIAAISWHFFEKPIMAMGRKHPAK